MPVVQRISVSIHRCDTMSEIVKQDSGTIVTMGLTTKQERFSKLVALDGLSISEAYKQSYDTENMKIDSIYQLSSRLSKQVKITSRIEALKLDISDKLASEVVWDKARFINEAEANLLQSRDLGQMNPANTSLQLIGRVTGILEDKPQNQVNIGIIDTMGKLPDALLEQLEALASEPVAIDDTGSIEASYKLLETEPDGA